ncbi:MAG: potassium/proton antiporter [Candidatus Hydrogenedens sp.]|nr:potassium/proton antiporter [Candidatus Hydrogenedens sp.]
MPDVPALLLITGLLVFSSIVASRLSSRFGIPALALFLGIGMLAGSDGPGGIAFDNAAAANLVGTVALAFILFSGGIDTNWQLMRPVLLRGTLLSTAGVVITAALVGLFGWLALGFPPTTSFLIGAIISSTDAAAVFSVLRGRGIGLKGNLKSLLELESGSNDPVAIFLTLGLTRLITAPEFNWATLLPLFALNMAGGIAAGLLVGKLAAYLFNRVRLDQEGLYPVLSLSLVLLTFGAAETFGGNGFLAVYICGLMMNGIEFTHKRSVVRFHDGLAWLMQITMFLVLGLLVFPSQLPAVAGPALLVAVFLMFAARPIAVAAALWGSRYSRQEKAFVAWTGLRGAVPIVLATFPLLAGYENSSLVFNVVFFTVLTSVLIQGSLLMHVARWLGVDAPAESPAAFKLEIERKGQTQGDTREVQVLPDMAAAGCKITDLGIPSEVVILLIGRGEEFVVPRGLTRIEPYDTLLLFGRSDGLREAVAHILSPALPPPRQQEDTEPLAALPLTTDEKYLSRHVVIVGYGRVGRLVAEQLEQRGIPYVAADQNRGIVAQLRALDKPAVLGDAANPLVLAQAHCARAAVLVIATPDTLKARQIADNARAMNAGIRIIIRSHSEMDTVLLADSGTVLLGEQELASSIVREAAASYAAGAGQPPSA